MMTLKNSLQMVQKKRQEPTMRYDVYILYLIRKYSWHKQEKQTSEEGFPISVFVRKAKGKGKRKAGSKKKRTAECVDPTKTSKKLFLEEVSGSIECIV
ncbi:predicted protein [Arabidopsis lyrata subsp. lyrata]|uniref:Predicted protein n=1 Tax=Arabidopsis lyrata subsp. lyrata TaxID=81972 RepID=D7LE83_ARALL|nr:predicted protein [Arabidopsis lyrata subsp. lyrata]